ncbi:CocE/NonD family hydrolase [Candidatus Viridilinea mediisalina]|uniref:X-Pro dipeptidyl-peptidase n=1 Tax=Candidatus Viridilinea mediisalina TaxID=2024553 RepID=A0A2A6RKV0_9CHLR|nr:CocE/NonD family hydrolase [Candidatus Viridilinea mediisalina]PDW03563.1 X-Pro dipeptidyl-peptidase [Candidatus Viridilinea mediisalina]
MNRRGRVTLLAAAGLLGAGLFAARHQLMARALGLRPPQYAVRLERNLPIVMPDGVTLYADHFAPVGAGSFPTILIRSPYGRPSEAGLLGFAPTLAARLFAERGYHVIYQGTRGRYRSEGHFEPFSHEASDGHATLAWIAEQPWFEGNVGMWGLSYLGYTQWAVAADAPPFLKALVPVITTSRFGAAFNSGGSFAYETALRWASLVQSTANPGADLDLQVLRRTLDPRLERRLHEAWATQPFAEADRHAVGAPIPFFQQWLNEPDPDGYYWRQVDHHRRMNHVSAAVHLVAAWYDIFLSEQLDDYTDLLAAGQSPCLTVLPAHHTENSVLLAAIREGLWWFDAHLKGQRELLKRRAVRLALMGSNEWHEMDFWPPPANHQRLFLHAGGGLSEQPPAYTQPSFYCCDPGDPTPSIGGPVLSSFAGPCDQRPLERRKDLLIFTTEPLEHDLDVIGYVRLELFAQANLRHYDLVARLCQVDAHGRSINVCEGLLRVEPDLDEQQPDGSRLFELTLNPTAQRFRAGQRLRLHICSAAHPRWSVNSGDGRLLHEGAPVGLRLEQNIFHDPNHPSALILPVVSPETRRAMAGER